MKILLARPKVPDNSIGLHNFMICDPIELEVVGAGIPARHEVRIHDGILDSGRSFRDTLRSFEPDVVAFTTYINGVNIVAAMAAAAKAELPRCLTVVGGVHATRNHGDFVKARHLDVVVRGEGVLTFAKLLEAYESGGLEALTSVTGCHVRRDGGFTDTATPDYPHPDDVPFARRELVKHHWGRYKYLYHNPCHLIKTAWGCPYTCSFCYCWQATEGHYSFRSPEAFVDEIERMWSSGVYIVDDDFFLHPGRMMKIHDLIVKRGIKKTYFAYGRADFIAKHPDIVKAWSEIGLEAVVVGVESAVDSELDYFNKESDAAANIKCFEVLRKYDVDPYASFILNPNWDLKDFEKIQKYIYDNKLYYVILQPLMPLPGTAIWDQWKDHVIIDRDHHEMWDISHLALPSKLPMETYFREMVKLYMRTCLDLTRLPDVKLRTLKSVFSTEVPRVLFGGMKILWQIWNAKSKYLPHELARYERGRELIATGLAQGPAAQADSNDYELIRQRIAIAEAGTGVAPTIAALAAGATKAAAQAPVPLGSPGPGPAPAPAPPSIEV